MPYPHALTIEALWVKEEAVYGTDPTPTSAEGVRGVGRIWGALSPEWAFPNTREDVVSGSLVEVAPGVPQGRIVTFDYTVELKGAGAAYSSSTPVRPEVDPLLMACAMSRTHVDTGDSESVAYALADTGHSSCTAWAHAGGKLFKITHLRGTWTWAATAGGLGRIKFTIQGIVTGVTEVANPATTYDSTKSPAAVAMALALVPNGGASWSPDVANLEVTAGHNIVRLDDVNAAGGIEGFFANKTKSLFSFSPRVVALSTYDPYAHAATRIDHTIDMTLGPTQYERVKLDVNEAYLMNDPGPNDDNGFAGWQAEYFCRDVKLLFD